MLLGSWTRCVLTFDKGLLSLPAMPQISLLKLYCAALLSLAAQHTIINQLNVDSLEFT
jgi:hypothetical protein